MKQKSCDCGSMKQKSCGSCSSGDSNESDTREGNGMGVRGLITLRFGFPHVSYWRWSNKEERATRVVYDYFPYYALPN